MISRTTLVAALVVVELAIISAAGQAIAGGHRHFHETHPGWGESGHRHSDPVVTTLDRTFAAGGITPHVIVDVTDVPVTVQTASTTGVHVVGTVRKSGFENAGDGAIAAVQTADGARITAGNTSDVPGDFERTLRLTVPAGALVEIASGGRIEASGLRAKLIVHVGDGSIRIANHRGDLDVSTGSGAIELVDVQAEAIGAHTKDGHLKLTTVGAEHLDAHTKSGHVAATDLRAADGALTTDDGHVEVTFAADSDANVNLHTDNGSIIGAGAGDTTQSAESRTVRLGSARGNFTVSTASGTITVSQGAKV
jgi:hypothetical protein